jgi:hypothetical protein
MLQNDDNVLKEKSPDSTTLRVDEEPESNPELEAKSATDSQAMANPTPPSEPAALQPESDPDPSPPSATPFDPSAEYRREIDYTPTKLVPTSWTYFYMLGFLFLAIPLIILFWNLFQAVKVLHP